MKSILARSLFKSYDGINAVDGIDLDVEEGQIFGFLGIKDKKKNRCGFATAQLRTNTFSGKISR